MPRWVEDVLAGRPYRDAESLWGRAEEGASHLDDAELEMALDRHPRIGERPSESGHDAAFSQREQAGVNGSDPDVARRLAEGNRPTSGASTASSSSVPLDAPLLRSSRSSSVGSATTTRPSAMRRSRS